VRTCGSECLFMCTFRNCGRRQRMSDHRTEQTSCVLTFVVGKTCKQAVAHGRLVVGAIEMTCYLCRDRS